MNRLISAARNLPRFLLTALVLAAILYLTLWPNPVPDDTMLFPYQDKVAHLLMFMGLSAVGCLDWAHADPDSHRLTLTKHGAASMAIVATVIGGCIEIAQENMGLGRSGDWSDFVCDAIGALLGAVIMLLILHRPDSSHSSSPNGSGHDIP